MKDLWVPAMSKELHRLAQGKEGVTVGTNTIFYLTHDEIRCIPKDRTVTYARIVIDHRPKKDDPNRVRITVGGNLIDYQYDTHLFVNCLISFSKHFLTTASNKPELVKEDN